jgi:hypothetical protein
MIAETSVSPPSRHTAWKPWANPIFRRYCRSRLRPRGLFISLLIVVLLAGFLFSITRSIGQYRVDLSAEDAARGPLIPLLVLQALILFVLGTAQVSGGMTAERDEGVIDYQRLIPMSPLAKVFGYLFGLPIREYVMVFATMPFTAWSLWKGGVEMKAWLPLYCVFFTSTLLYHFTGLVTGTVVKNRRWAFLVSIGLVFCLYTIVPQMAKFGLVFFKYLTITPVFEECLPGILPKTAGSVISSAQRLIPTAKFFNLDFPEAVFTVFSQGGLVLTFIAMLRRRWKRSESHLLGKLWATLLFIWFQILLLGNALPLVESGSLFPSRGIAKYTRLDFDWEPNRMEAVGMSGLYGVVTLAFLFILGGLITPSPEQQTRGWRRVRKQGKNSLPFLSDAATGSWFSGLMAIAGAVGWYLFTRALVESRWFPGHGVPLSTLGYFVAVMLAAGLGFQVLLETRGGRAIGLATIVFGVAPIMIGAVMFAIGDWLFTAASWVIGMSPLSLPLYAAGSLLSLSELPDGVERAIPRAFHFWLLVAMLVTGWLIAQLRAARARMAARILADGG